MLPLSTLAETAAITWGGRERKEYFLTMEAAHSAFFNPHDGGGLRYSKISLVGKHAKATYADLYVSFLLQVFGFLNFNSHWSNSER